MPSWLLVLAQDGFVETQVGSLFCPQVRRLRERCLGALRRSRRYGC